MNYKIALLGNPNNGKTTLFNALTGSDQYVGNWPGVTVERREAYFEIGQNLALLCDLPGVYSLSPYSIEEKITREFIEKGRPDVLLNVVDATRLERNLYLTFQLLETGRPTVVALNLMDEVSVRGGKIDCARLSKALRAAVVPISAKKRTGFDALFKAIDDQARNGETPCPFGLYDESTKKAIDQIRSIGGFSSQAALAALAEGSANPQVQKIAGEYVLRGQKTAPGIDAQTLVAACRYRAIGETLSAIGYQKPESREEARSIRIDRWVLNRFLAYPIFFIALALVFYVTFGPIGSWLSAFLEGALSLFSRVAHRALLGFGAPFWMISLIVDGVFAGVGGVLCFLPQILLIFLCLSILEDSGYMARAAFITDRLLRGIGLSGRSFIPMLLGFGCTTTAVVAARGVENERDRRMTILLTPFMSCGAKLPVYALFAAALFGGDQAPIIFSLYLLGMLVMALLGIFLRKTFFKTGETPFLMELPPYRMPDAKNIARRLKIRTGDFLIRAGTLIFMMSVLVWFLRRFTPGLCYVEDASQSMFGRIGTAIAPIFGPLGFGDWQRAAALLSGLVAKEAVVSALKVIYSAGDMFSLAASLRARFTPLSAYSFLTFILLYMPCLSATASMARELRSKKTLLLGLFLQWGSAYLFALLIYQIGKRLFPHLAA